ncbi:MAG: hypothetical protein ACKO91_18595 [Acidimicrobiales bacterium]
MALDDFRMHRLALVIAEELRAGQGSTWRSTEGLDDVTTWRRAARRAGRLLDVSIRTGVAPDGSAWTPEWEADLIEIGNRHRRQRAAARTLLDVTNRRRGERPGP